MITFIKMMITTTTIMIIINVPIVLIITVNSIKCSRKAIHKSVLYYFVVLQINRFHEDRGSVNAAARAP